MPKRTPRIIVFAMALVLAACNSMQTNPTVYPYKMDSTWFSAHQPKRVAIAPFSLSGDSRAWLKEGQQLASSIAEEYLEEHGYTVVNNNALRSAWSNAIRVHGNPWDPLTGKANMETLARVVSNTLANAQQTTPVDLVIVIDVIEREVLFEQYGDYRARWDGVARKPKLVGPDNYVTEDFDWDRPVKATSAAINIYTPEFQNVFHSIGGIGLAQDINTRTGSIGFTRKEEPFRYQSHIEEGIALAFHPFIPMRDYPAPKSNEAKH